MVDKPKEAALGPAQRLLALDGGRPGRTEVSELILLQKFMEGVEFDEDLSEIPRPYRYFDLIGGSGTGGLFALLLGRLRMSVDEAIKAYHVLHTKVFSTVEWQENNIEVATSTLRDAIKELISKAECEIGEPLFQSRDEPCKTFVCTVNPENMSSPRLLRTYKSRSGRSPACSLLDALCASIAFPEHLKPISLGDPPLTETFIAASQQYSNPTYQVIQESNQVSREPQNIACIVSLGSGHPGLLSVPKDGPVDYESLLRISEDCERQAGVFDRMFSGLDNLFFRFSVAQGMQDVLESTGSSDILQSIVTHTIHYCNADRTSKSLNRLVTSLCARPALVTSERINFLCGPDIKDQLYSSISEIRSDVKDILVNQISAEDNAILSRLRSENPVSELPHEPCMEDTRVDVLREILEWINDSNGSTIFWLYGHPGTGKSTIAVSVRNQLRNSGKLGACFFFRRSEAIFQSPSALWRSIAYQLSQKSSEFRAIIVDCLRKAELDPSNSTSSEIFANFLKTPLVSISSSGTLSKELPVIIIDAVDECGGFDSREFHQDQVLTGLQRLSSLPLPCKIFVTSRNHDNIASVLEANWNKCKSLDVGDDTSKETSDDIRLFLRRSFDRIAKGFRAIKPPWPTDAEIEQLTVAAGGLFIWASTVVKIASRPSALAELLRNLGNGAVSGNLDSLYITVLDTACRDLDESKLFQTIMGAVAVLRSPLAAESLASLLQIEDTDMEYVCRSLKPVLDSESIVRFLHQSFVDFVLSKKCPENFRCDVEAQEQKLSEFCFSAMKRELRFNIGNVASSYVLNSDVPAIDAGISDSLYYSCRFWSEHLEKCKSNVAIEDAALELLQNRLMFWLEVLSIKSNFGIATKSLEILTAWALPSRSDMSTLARDGVKFLHTFGTPISLSYPHIYVSASVFAPISSKIRAQYLKKIQNAGSLKSGHQNDWHNQLGIIGHGEAVYYAVFSPDGSKIVSASAADGAIRIWDADTLQPIGDPLRCHDVVISANFSPDGRRIVSASADKTVRIWDVDTQQPIGEPLRGHDDCVKFANFSPDGRKIVSASGDKTVRVWDAETQASGDPFRGHESCVYSANFSPDGRRIVSASADGTIRIWDAETQQPVGDPLQGHDHLVSSANFSPDGRRIVSASADKTVRIWDADTQQPIGDPLLGHDALVHFANFSLDGRRIVSASADQTVRVWDADTQQPIGEPLQGHDNEVSSANFAPNGERILTASHDSTIRIWSADTHQPIGEPLQGHDDYVNFANFSPDGRKIVSASDDDTIRIWDGDTLQPIGDPLRGHGSKVIFANFSPDGRRIVSASADGTIRIWDAETQQPIGEPLRGHDNAANLANVSPDGQRIVYASHFTVRIWDAGTQKPIGEPLRGHDRFVKSANFSPDGRRIVSASFDETVRIWDTDTQQPIGEPLRGHDNWVNTANFSPDGRRIVSASKDNTVRIWDADTQQPIGDPLQGHDNCVNSANFSPDGRRIVSTSADKTVRIWNADTQKPIGDPLRGHNDLVTSANFSLDGRRIVSASYDQTVWIWDAEQFFLDHEKTCNVHEKRFFTDNGRFSHHVTIQPNGWIVGPNSERLLWVPNHLIDYLPWPYQLGICGKQSMITFDLSKICHGKDWTRSYIADE